MGFKLPALLTSYIIRGLQLVFAIIVLGTGARVVDLQFTTGRAGFAVAVAVLTIVYVPLLLVSSILVRIPAVFLVGLESFFFILWLIAMALVADAGYGSATCSTTYYYSGYHYSTSSLYTNACRTGKALLAFSVLAWLSFLATAIIFVVFTILPNRTGLGYSTKIDTHPGGLFATGAYPAHAGGEEAAIEAEEEHKAVVTETASDEVVEPTVLSPTDPVAEPTEPVAEPTTEPAVVPVAGTDIGDSRK